MKNILRRIRRSMRYYTLNSCLHSLHPYVNVKNHGFGCTASFCCHSVQNALKVPLGQQSKSFSSRVSAEKLKNEKKVEFTSRNRILQAVIREGLIHINHGAASIQKNQVAQRSILQTKKSNKSNTIYNFNGEDDENLPTSKQLSEGKRLLNAATRSLQEVCDKNSYQMAPFMINDEPITLLTVRVRPSLKNADLYWTLPTDVLLDDSLTIIQKIKLQNELQKRIESVPEATGWWMKRMYTILSRYYPAKLRLQAATPMMIQEAMLEFDGEARL